MSNKIRYRFFSILYGLFRSKTLRYKKLAIGAMIIASACAGGSDYKARKIHKIVSQLRVVELIQKDSLIEYDSTFISPIDSSFLYPVDCYAEEAPVMCYDEAVEPDCYDIVTEPPIQDINEPDSD